MKKALLVLALATMIISCKETTTEKTEEIREEPAMENVEPAIDTVSTQTETTVDTTQMGGNQSVKKTEKTTKVVK